MTGGEVVLEFRQAVNTGRDDVLGTSSRRDDPLGRPSPGSARLLFRQVMTGENLTGPVIPQVGSRVTLEQDRDGSPLAASVHPDDQAGPASATGYTVTSVQYAYHKRVATYYCPSTAVSGPHHWPDVDVFVTTTITVWVREDQEPSCHE